MPILRSFLNRDSIQLEPMEARMNDAIENKKTKERSPNFPFISLQTALERAQEFYDKEKRGTAPYVVAAKHWDYSPTSSGALQTAAALKQYGLMADEGGGGNRKMRLTDLALRILLDTRPDSVEREQFKRQAALTPPVAAEIYEKWPTELPSPENLNHYLVLERGFSQQTALKVANIIKENETFTATPHLAIISGRAKTDLDLGMEAKGMTTTTSQPLTGVRQDTFSMDEGLAVLRWPETLSKESFAEFKDWIDLQVRKIARSSGVDLLKKKE